jgi:hypothetical protein
LLKLLWTYLIESWVAKTQECQKAEYGAEEDSSHRGIAVICPTKSCFQPLVSVQLRNGKESPAGNVKASVSTQTHQQHRLVEARRNHTYPAVYAEIRKQALRNLGSTLIPARLTAIIKGECETRGASGSVMSHGWERSGSMRLIFRPTRKDPRM